MRLSSCDLVMVGPLPPPVGGASRTFEEYVGALRELDLRVHVVDISPERVPHRLRRAYKPLIALRIALHLVQARAARKPVAWFQNPKMIFQLHPLLRVVERSGCALYSFGGELGEELLLFRHGRRRHVVANLRRARRIFVETDLSASELGQAGLDSIQVVGCFRRSPPPAPADHPRVLGPLRIAYVGHLREGKGIPELFRLADLSEGGLVIDLHGPAILGFEPELRELCRNARWVSWRGPIQPARVPEVLAGADFSILLSSYPGEGYPGAVLESLLVGTPVIVSRHRALPELIQDGVSGFVVDRIADSWDLASLRDRLLALDESGLARLRRGAVERARTSLHDDAPRRIAAAVGLEVVADPT